MIGFREKVVTNGLRDRLTDKLTDMGQSIGPTSKVGGSKQALPESSPQNFSWVSWIIKIFVTAKKFFRTNQTLGHLRASYL